VILTGDQRRDMPGHLLLVVKVAPLPVYMARGDALGSVATAAAGLMILWLIEFHRAATAARSVAP
jgi:hypothetical protein